MISCYEDICPICGGKLKYYDSVRRIVRTKNHRTGKTILHRYRCLNCGKIHREIPNYIFPYKQYESEIIIGVIEGLITSDTLGFEDYPCEATMNRWIARNKQLIL